MLMNFIDFLILFFPYLVLSLTIYLFALWQQRKKQKKMEELFLNKFASLENLIMNWGFSLEGKLENKREQKALVEPKVEPIAPILIANNDEGETDYEIELKLEILRAMFQEKGLLKYVDEMVDWYGRVGYLYSNAE